MTAPTFLSSTFRYLLLTGVTDVDTIISNFRTETVTNGGWSEPDTAIFKSPVDADGRWFSVTLSKIDAEKLNALVKNWNGATIMEKRCEIDAEGTSVRLFTGARHFYIETLRTTPEHVGGGFLDQTPEAQSSHGDTIYGVGYRDTSNNASNQGLAWAFNLDASASGQDQPRLVFQLRSDGSVIWHQTVQGSYVFSPVGHVRTSGSGNPVLGRRYQMLLCYMEIAAGTELEVPIDVGTTGTFIVTGCYDNAYKYRLAVRKA